MAPRRPTAVEEQSVIFALCVRLGMEIAGTAIRNQGKMEIVDRIEWQAGGLHRQRAKECRIEHFAVRRRLQIKLKTQGFDSVECLMALFRDFWVPLQGRHLGDET